jgi:ABC-type multidrug transport system fused ATPase/permease subunit
MLIACYYLLRHYSKSLKETSRLESISSSPIITHIGETITGASTIRTFNKSENFIMKEYFLQDQNVACQLLRRGVKGWFNTRISLVLIMFMSFTFIYCVLAKSVMDPVLIGLMMVYLMEIQFNLVSLFRQMASIDARMV